MRSIIFKAIAGIILVGVLATGLYWFVTGRFIESTNNAYVEADIAVIAPRVGGYVSAVKVDDNQAVRRGDILAIIDDTDYRAKSALAQAEVMRSTSVIGSSQADEASQEDVVRQAEAALTAAQAEEKRARADLSRYGELNEKRWISRQRYDAMVAEAASRTADVARAQATLAAERSKLAAFAKQRDAASAGRAAASAEMESAHYDLGNTVIRAPIDGVVGNRSIRVGQYAQPGRQLMVIVPIEKSYVVANFKETQIARMQPGQPVEIHVDAYPDAELTGRIESLSPASGSRFSLLPPENATGNFTKIVQRIPVKILVDRPLPEGIRLAPGMSIVARIDVRSKPDGNARP